jgi:predicted hydrocarbon binding protein
LYLDYSFLGIIWHKALNTLFVSGFSGGAAMSRREEVIPWWQGKLKDRDLMKAFFAKTWNKLANRIGFMFPDQVRDLYYSAGRLAGLEAQREYFKIGKQRPPKNFKEIIEFIKTVLSFLLVPFGDVAIENIFKASQDEEAVLRIPDNPYASGYESEEPSCFFLKGFIEAITEYLVDFNKIEYEKLVVTEDTCMSAKMDACRFRITLSHPAQE